MMIRINLLPEEYRRNERGSPKVFAALLGAVVSVSAALGWFGKVYFGDLAELEAEHQRVAENLTRKSQGASYFDQLQRQSKDYTERVDTIQTIGMSRRLWTEFLDQVVDVASNNTDLERHITWFDKVSIREGNQAAAGPRVELPGAVQGQELSKLSNLHRDIAGAPFFVDVQSKSPPMGTVERAKEKTPEESFKFSLTLDFLPASQWAKNGGRDANTNKKGK